MSVPDRTVPDRSVPNTPPEEENKHHDYVSHTIPWYVHILWICFWILAISYVLIYQVPALRREILSPP